MRSPLPLAFALSLAAAAAAQEAVTTPEVSIDRIGGSKARNVIFILSDDHRYDALGFMGHPFLKTPHLDSLARNGAHLKNAMVTTALCSPSRASILTGLYTHRHRVIDNNRPVPAGVRFFPEYLQKAGYETAFLGKWHMGGESDDPRPGFDHWISFRGQGTYLPGPAGLNINGKRIPQKGYITDELTDYAIEWLGSRDMKKPFFLYLSHKAVHAEFVPAARHAGKYADAKWDPPRTAGAYDGYRNQPRWMRDQRNSWHGTDFPYHSDLDVAQYYRSYCETLLAVDDSVGRILGWLREKGLMDSTLVLYMGDNGFLFGEHGLIDKRVAYEESIRVPMLMQCPELFSGGTVVTQVVANIDVGPTILEAAGIRTPSHMDGASFLPLAQGRPAPWREDFLYVYYWEKNFPQSPTVFALRGDRYKYATYYGLWDCDEFYDIAADPGETVNLIASKEHQPLIRKMEDRLYAILGERGGMFIPLNQPKGGSQNKRLEPRGGRHAADFPDPLIVPSPLNKSAK